MILRSAIALMTIFMATQAHAACKQVDIRGTWRFVFDIGYTPAGETRSLRLSCLLRIKGNGVIVPRKCETVNATTDAGAFSSYTNRRLRMKANACEVFIGGTSGGPDFALEFGDVPQYFNGASLTISENKDMMLGSLSYDAFHVATVTAIKRATP